MYSNRSYFIDRAFNAGLSGIKAVMRRTSMVQCINRAQLGRFQVGQATAHENSGTKKPTT